MRGPKPAAIDLSDAARQALDLLVRRHTTPQQIALPHPDFEQLAITDDGQSVLFGEYEVSTDNILYAHDVAYRKRAKARQQVVLGLMVEAGFITAGEADAAWLEELNFAPLQYDMQAPHFTLFVMQQLEELLGSAEPLYERALAISEAALGKSHPEIADALSNLALLYFDQGLYSRAEPLSERALAIC